jgi:cholinesterase
MQVYRKMKFLPVFALMSIRSALAVSIQNAEVQLGESIETTSGLVSGHDAPWPKNGGVSEYLGIPYAEPPLGQLRFAAPQTYKPKGAISGANFVCNVLTIYNHYKCAVSDHV